MATERTENTTMDSALQHAQELLETYEEMVRVAPTKEQRETAQKLASNQREKLVLMKQLAQSKGGNISDEETRKESS
jgi:hypothetical protein